MTVLEPNITPYPGSFGYLVNEVIIWGRARQIIQNSNSRAQASKCLEEVDELLDHTSQSQMIRSLHEGADSELEFKALHEDLMPDIQAKIKDDIGDVLVTLIMVAEIESLDLTECLAAAYDEIKDRKGYLGTDGKFHKED